jgi:ATP-dependent Clp protease ATP-binding subunit ClpA
MQDRFEPELRAAMQRARLIAQGQGVHRIGTDHLALGLLTRDVNAAAPCVAAQVLQGVGVDLAALGRAMQGHLERGEVRFFPVQMPFDEHGGRALELSLRGGDQMGHAMVGSEHLLAILVQQPDGALPKALGELGVEPQRIVEALSPVFEARPRQGSGQADPGAAGAGAAAAGQFTESAQRVLGEAAKLSSSYGHGPAGTPHLVLALLADADRMLPSLLRRAGLNPSDVRAMLLEQLRVPKDTTESK